jgi:hypothetical protein
MGLLAVESKTEQAAFWPRLVDLRGAGEQFWESGHHAKF